MMRSANERRRLARLAALAALITAPLAGCGDDGSAGADPAESAPDVGSANGGGADGTPDADTAVAGRSGWLPTVPDAAAPPTESPGDADAGPAGPDALPPDMAWAPHLAEPQGFNYLHDPITDEGELTPVSLPETTSPDGRLTNASVQVFNCLKEEGGVSAQVFGNITATLCHEVQDTRPDPDGHYFSIVPPEDESDGNDQFAGIMMYRNVTRAHDYFKGTHGVDWMDFPLPAIVNLEFKITPPISLGGFSPGPDGWYDFANAAYFPKESWDALASQLGLPPRDSDSIIFGQAGHDFSYDASVIIHEYTHAIIGTSRLNGRAFDRQGIDDAPRAMNEALADYFAATIADYAVVGRYGIGKLARTLVRDLEVKRRCPDDLVNEIHADGRIFGAALWAIRGVLGAETADRIVFGALEQIGQDPGFEQAGELLLAETESVAPSSVETVRGILVDHGVLGCERAKEWRTFSAAQSEDQVPYVVEGRQTVGLNIDAVPGFNQFYVDLEPGTVAIELGWTMSAGGGIPGFGGGGVGKLDVAVRAGAPLEYGYGRTLEVTADQRVSVPEATQTPGGTFVQAVTLTAGCLPPEGGRLYIGLLNVADNAAQIINMRKAIVAAGETVAEDAPAVQTCEATP
jgi:hypothetical protein